MAIDEQSGSGIHAGMHGHSVGGVGLDEDKADPVLARAGHIGAQATEEPLSEFPDIQHRGPGDDGLADSGRRFDQVER